MGGASVQLGFGGGHVYRGRGGVFVVMGAAAVHGDLYVLGRLFVGRDSSGVGGAFGASDGQTYGVNARRLVVVAVVGVFAGHLVFGNYKFGL